MTACSPEVGIFCNPESRRVEGFHIALGRIRQQRPILIPWKTVLERETWQEKLQSHLLLLRLESPGRNFEVEKSLLRSGAKVIDEEGSTKWRTLSCSELNTVELEHGRVLPMREWFLGWRKTLLELKDWADRMGLSSKWLSPPEDVICMFDKALCQKKLESEGIAMPPSLGIPGTFEELWEMMEGSGYRRIFIKPCHGSSASGVVAMECSGGGIQAFSTLEVMDRNGKAELFNHRRIRKFIGVNDVRRLVEAILPERCIVQAWVPKAGIGGRPFDLRVVVINGKARHMMMRLGRGPMTNSQLLGGKGDVETLKRKMGKAAWENMVRLCEATMVQCFPKSLYAGLDVLIEPDFRSATILEVNAFGDLLPRVLHDNRDTYEWEILEAFQRYSSSPIKRLENH